MNQPIAALSACAIERLELRRLLSTVGFSASSVNVGSDPSAIAVGDLNGDGIPDVVVANQYDNSISILFGNGDGTFQPQLTLATDPNPDAVAIADLNGDGNQDVVVATRNGP